MTTTKRQVHEAPDSFRIYNVINGTGVAVAAWTPFLYGGGYVIPATDMAVGATDGVCIFNVVMELPATTADAWSDGDDLYWDPATGKLTDVPGALTYIGKARGAKVATTQTSAAVFIGAPPSFAIGGDAQVHTVAGGTLVIPTSGLVLKTTGGAEALTLANGTREGQEVEIVLVSDGGDGTLTPATATGWATIVFADVKDKATLRWHGNGVGWTIVGLSGTAAPPAHT